MHGLLLDQSCVDVRREYHPSLMLLLGPTTCVIVCMRHRPWVEMLWKRERPEGRERVRGARASRGRLVVGFGAGGAGVGAIGGEARLGRELRLRRVAQRRLDRAVLQAQWWVVYGAWPCGLWATLCGKGGALVGRGTGGSGASLEAMLSPLARLAKPAKRPQGPCEIP